MRILENLDVLVENAIKWMGLYGPIFSCFLICVESIVPILPLSVFITLNFLTFGNILGFLISWVFTVVGCCISFWICRKNIKLWFEKKIRNKAKADKVMKFVDNCTAHQLTVIVALPFTPAFLVNIAAGLSKMSFKKYFWAIMIGKIFMIYFWGFVGTSLLQSIKDPTILIQVVVLILIAYVFSKLLNKKFNLD